MNVDVIKSHVIQQVAGTLHVSEAEMRLPLFKLMLRRQLLCHFMFHFLVGCPQPFAWPRPQPRWRSSATRWSGVRTNAGLFGFMDGRPKNLLRHFHRGSCCLFVSNYLCDQLFILCLQYFKCNQVVTAQCYKGSCWGCLSSIFRIHIIFPCLSC